MSSSSQLSSEKTRFCLFCSFSFFFLFLLFFFPCLYFSSLKKALFFSLLPTLVIDLSDGNPWDTRLTDMHNFFGTKDKNQQKSIEQRFASLSSPSLIPSLIDEILGDGESFSHTINVGAMEGIVRGIVASGMFEEMLKYIISSPDVLGEVASLSDHHDLFDKTVLFKV